MAWPLLLIVALTTTSAPHSPPTTTTTIPESPGAGLALAVDPVPVAKAQPASVPMQPPPPSPPIAPGWAAMAAGMAVLAGRARRISGARRTIRDALQDNLFHDVGHADLATIAHTLDDLTAGEAQAVIGSLSDHELGVWLRELDGWRGGFDHLEQEHLFIRLSELLSSSQLTRLIREGKGPELVDAASVAAPSHVQSATAIALWGELDPTHDAWPGIATLFAAADRKDQRHAVAAVVPGPLMVNLLGVTSSYDGSARLHLEALSRFLDLAASFEDSALKADIFVAGQRALIGAQRLRASGNTEKDTVVGGLGSLVRSDPSGVVTQLSHRADPHGDVFSEWVGAMIDADRLDELDVILTGLVGGSDRLAHFTTPGTSPARPYPNAANLGYYVGSYGLAIDDIADSAEDQITLVGRLFAIVTAQVPGPNNTWVRLPLGPLVDAHSRAVVDGLRDEATSLKQTLWGLAKPRTADGLLWNGPGTTQFQDAWEEVVLVR